MGQQIAHTCRASAAALGAWLLVEALGSPGAAELRLLERSRLSRRVARRSAEKAAVAVSDWPCRLLKCSSARASAICPAGDPAQTEKSPSVNVQLP